MSGLTMKSDISETKTRSEGRQYLPRRRISKPILINGEYDPDLALAIQESLRMAELEQARTKENQENKSVLSSHSDSKMNKSSEKTPSKSDQGSESKQLKDLLLLHFDLIQQQQELINKKDIAIKKLNSEKQALECRLERMERRMSLLKQKEETPEKSAMSPPHTERVSYTEVHMASPEKGRRKALEPQNLTKKLASPVAVKEEIPATITSPVQHKTESAVPSSQIKQRKRKYRPDSSRVSVSECQDGDLKTQKHYYVSYYKPISDEIDTTTRPDIIRSAQDQIQVETPTWRTRTYTNLYVLEGTENLEDEIFIKRHQKPELEEKRRKRWDAQRIREQRMYENLKKKDRYGEDEQKEEGNVLSFYPRLDSIAHIEIEDDVPVTAFGHSIPLVKSTEFELPWEPEVKRSYPCSSRTRYK